MKNLGMGFVYFGTKLTIFMAAMMLLVYMLERDDLPNHIKGIGGLIVIATMGYWYCVFTIRQWDAFGKFIRRHRENPTKN